MTQDLERRIVRLIAQRCDNRLVSRIVGVSTKTVARVRRRLKTILDHHRAETMKASLIVPCVKCRNPIHPPPPEQHGLCGVCFSPPTKEPVPTATRVGTPERVDVYAARVRQKQILFHKLDGQVDDSAVCATLTRSRSEDTHCRQDGRRTLGIDADNFSPSANC